MMKTQKQKLPHLFEVETTTPPPKQLSPQKAQEHFVESFMDVLTAPVLTHTQSWADAIPKRLLDIITISRLVSLKQKEELATYPEVAAYLYTASHEAPMQAEWAEIYIHVTCTVCEKWFNESRWTIVNGKKTLDEWHEKKLTDLRRFIYNKRRAIVKARLKASAKDTETPALPPPAAPGVQQATFSF